MGNKNSIDTQMLIAEQGSVQYEHEHKTISLREIYYKDPWDNIWQQIPTLSNYLYHPINRNVITINGREKMGKSVTRFIEHFKLQGLTQDCFLVVTPEQEEKIREIAKRGQDNGTKK
jgi:hypothetical protein